MTQPRKPDEAVYEFVQKVPAGKVVTYGQVAEMITDVRLTARMVGAIMNWSPPEVPFQRVVGAGGRLPIGKRSPDLRLLQIKLLVEEGVGFRANETVRMEEFQWQPDVETTEAPQP